MTTCEHNTAVNRYCKECKKIVNEQCQHGISIFARCSQCEDITSDPMVCNQHVQTIQTATPLAKQFEKEWPEGVEGIYTNTPRYYRADKSDLYDIFIETYGMDVWLRHVEMEVIQYVTRARLKGQYIDDITKARVILDRILAELNRG